MPVCPNVADFFSLVDEDDAGEPWYMSLFFFTPGVARVVLESFWHLLQTILTRDQPTLLVTVVWCVDLRSGWGDESWGYEEGGWM